MRAPLKIALVLAVLGAGWAAMQSDDGVELAATDKRGGPASRGRERGEATASADAPDGAARRGSRAAGAAPAASGAASAALPWTDVALAEGVQGWRLRQAEAEALPPARPMTQASPSAWASMAPPPPPPVKVVAPPPPPPMAPRFPHEWIGRVNDETVAAAPASSAAPAASAASAPAKPAPRRPIQRAVLAGPVATWVVREGDVIEGQWRVDSIQDRTMRLTYLPLQQSQTVSMK